ncbi:unnamed protein product [Larinioides sclopetarius]|uniref:Uncharacterized protein n=1 Tax=Larinioides sclopetarius TaxID=280406 RepID=A0AAV2AE99_9ARAC
MFQTVVIRTLPVLGCCSFGSYTLHLCIFAIYILSFHKNLNTQNFLLHF